jgi:uncharacterized phage protein gp47/JayE
MGFIRPTLPQLVDRIEQDLVSRLSLETPILRRAMVYVLSRVIAGAVHMLYGFLEFLAAQIFPDRSDGEYLARQAALFGLTHKAAAFAKGHVLIPANDGTPIPAGTVLVRSDGTEYTLDGDVTAFPVDAWAALTLYAVGDWVSLFDGSGHLYECIIGGTSAASGGPTGTGTAIVDGGVTWRFIGTNAEDSMAYANVTCSTAGTEGDCAAGQNLAFQSPVAGAAAAAYVNHHGLAGGAAEETDTALSARLIERMRSPPHGGNAADYVAWAKEIAGVTRAWCYPLEGGAGTVTVRFVRDDDASIIPDAGEVTAVQDHLDALAPVTAVVTVAAPIADALAYTIHLVPDTAATRAAVEAQLKDLLRRESEPGGTILLSRIRNAIGDSEGVTDYTLTTPAADVTHATGHMAVPGTITWT